VKYKLVVSLEFIGLMFILSGIITGFWNINYLSYRGDLLVIQGLLIEILAFTIYYGEQKYSNEVTK